MPSTGNKKKSEKTDSFDMGCVNDRTLMLLPEIMIECQRFFAKCGRKLKEDGYNDDEAMSVICEAVMSIIMLAHCKLHNEGHDNLFWTNLFASVTLKCKECRKAMKAHKPVQVE